MNDTPLTLREYVMAEKPVLADIFRAIFDHLRVRHDAVLVGAQAVNVYVDPPRMTHDVDILSTDAQGVAEDLRDLLARTFHIAVRLRTVADGLGWRVYQLRKPKNRHLVDVRQVDELPQSQSVEDVRVVAPAELVVLKLESYVDRRRTDKGLTDKVDLHRLLWAFPDFRSDAGPVARQLARASAEVRQTWAEIRDEPIQPSDDEAY
jgi:hypothetical protein